MQCKYSLILLILLSSFGCGKQGAVDDYDLVVYGGTSAGVMAAYAARQLDKSVLLIEPSAHIGGLTTGGLGQTDIGNKYAVTGLGRDFYRRVGDHYNTLEQWTPQLYIREARRMIGSYIMTEHNCLGDSVVDDGIALAAYTMDSHHCQRVVMKGPDGKAQVKNEGCIEIGGFLPYPISYRALTPKIQECKNLLVPVCLSASHIAFGSIRMEPVFMVLGQVTGVAASMAIDEGIPVQQISVPELQQTLREDPLLNGTPADVVVDDADEKFLVVKGPWEREEHFMRNYESSLLVSRDSSDRENNSLRFQVPVEKTGNYKVYYYCPRFRSSEAEYPGELSVEVYDGKDRKKTKFSYIENLGTWADLGEISVRTGDTPYVEVIGRESDFPLIADAVLFLPEQKN